MQVATMLGTQSDRLVADFVGFIHAFGVLRSDTTPCGQPMSVSTAHALCELATGPALSQRDLATRLGLTASTVSRLVDQLVEKGWAERCVDTDSTDTRIRLVVLTSDGDRIASQVLDARAQRFARLLDAVPDDKHSTVVETLHLLKVATDALD
jgi:DNA-binding MarR family transcriptional regulator